MSFEPVVPLESVNPEWLSKVLTATGYLHDATVTQANREPCGTGQLGDTYRFRLTYSRPDAGPASIVAKFPSTDETSREFGRQSGYYANEIQFYNTLEPQFDLSAARIIHSAIASNEVDFILLMEDMAPALVVDQLEGCSRQQSALVMEQAAALHSASWEKPELRNATEWSRGILGVCDQVTDSFGDIVQQLPELAGDLIPEPDIATAMPLAQHKAQWKTVYHTPQCLWHSDLRADNVLFDAQGGKLPVVVLDWQGLAYGKGSIDAALYLGTSMTVEDRRAHERELVTHYHSELLKRGVANYSAEQCWDDYRLHAIYGLQIATFGFSAVKRTPRGDKMWRSWIERTAAQVRDLDSYELLKKV